jgi:hypothetical protein
LAYQVGGTEKIKDDNTVTFKNVTVKNYYTFSVAPTGIGGGTTDGYRTGGAPGPTIAINVEESFPFSSDTNASDVGDLTQARGDHSCTNSSTSVYSAGGKVGYAGTAPATNVIDKFPISSGGNATDVGDTSISGRATAGQQSTSNGYATGGYVGPSPAAMQDRIDKYSFSSDGNATDIGNLTVGRTRHAGQSSETHGYTAGGGTFPPFIVRDEIDKFPFSTDTNATDVGNLNTAAEGGDGHSSDANGYQAGGWGPGQLNTIDKFPFSSDGNATDVGDLAVARASIGGSSSSGDNGYTLGGNNTNIIDKFPFSSDANATDVGDLTISTRDGGGAQG